MYKIENIINKIHCANCLIFMKEIPENSIDAIITDPPYGLSFMGKKWDYDVPSVEIWQECLRILKPGGYLLSFAGTRTQHKIAMGIEDAGFEIRDMIAWVYGSGFPKSLNIGKAIDKMQGNKRKVIGKKDGTYADIKRDKETGQDGLHGGIAKERNRVEVFETKGNSDWEGWGTALKPAFEPITIARKPLTEKTVAENCLKWGTGGINIDECRVEYTGKTDSRTFGGKWKTSKAAKNVYEGGYEGLDLPVSPIGRFPANFIHDGSQGVLDLFPNTKSGDNCIRTKEGKFLEHGGLGKAGDVQTTYGDNGSASRFFYCAKASKSERNNGCEELDKKFMNGLDKMGGEKCSMLTGSGNPREGKNSNNHPTVKPIALMKYLIKLVSRENAIVLDPFAGSGSTLIACKNLNRKYIGIEMSQEYVNIATHRL